MAFSFGASTPAPAAAPTPAAGTGGFSFGATGATPAPAPNTASAFSFGGTTPAAATATTPTAAATPAPSTGGAFSFGGATPAPAAPAPASGFSFGGATPAPATTPAPVAGGAFSFGGGTPAAAPATPAPSSAFSFGNSAPVTTPTTATPLSLGGTATQQQPQAPIQISPYTPYSSLPPQVQTYIDSIYNLVHQHQHTMASVESMSPALLVVQPNNNDLDGNNDAIDPAAGRSSGITTSITTPSNSNNSQQTNIPQSQILLDPTTTPLNIQISSLHDKVVTLQNSYGHTFQKASKLADKTEALYHQAFQYIAWPLESCAARKQVALPPQPPPSQFSSTSTSQPATGQQQQPGTNDNTDTQSLVKKLNQALESRASSVDRVEVFPSPYYLIVLQELEERMGLLLERMDRMKRELNRVLEAQKRMSEEEEHKQGYGDDAEQQVEDMKVAIQNQTQAFFRIASLVRKVHDELDGMRLAHKRKLMMNRGGTGGVSRGIGMGSMPTYGGIPDPFAEADMREIEQKKRWEEEAQRKTLAVIPASAQGQGAAAAAPTSVLGSTTPAPASVGLFGSTAPAPATGGGLFGSTPAAPAPASGGLFGATPAPAPATTGGGLFGGAATPAAPAPAAGGLFGSTPTPAAPAVTGFGAAPAAPATGGLFGGSATPAPAPATGGLFGGATPAPAFGATPAPAVSTNSMGSSRVRRKPGRRR